jgi:hypothetical protein
MWSENERGFRWADVAINRFVPEDREFVGGKDRCGLL